MMTSATIVNVQDVQRAALMEVLPVTRDQIESMLLQDNCICLVADGRCQGFVSLRLLETDFLQKLRLASRSTDALNGRHGVYFAEGGKTVFIGFEQLKSISVH